MGGGGRRGTGSKGEGGWDPRSSSAAIQPMKLFNIAALVTENLVLTQRV